MVAPHEGQSKNDHWAILWSRVMGQWTHPFIWLFTLSISELWIIKKMFLFFCTHLQKLPVILVWNIELVYLKEQVIYLVSTTEFIRHIFCEQIFSRFWTRWGNLRWLIFATCRCLCHLTPRKQCNLLIVLLNWAIRHILFRWTWYFHDLMD